MNRWLKTDTPGRELVFMLLMAIALIGLPWFLPLIGGYRELASTIVIWSILAIGLDILVGFTGFLSFGHAAFWGGGAYIAGLYLLHFTNNALIAMLCGIAVVALLAFAMALISLRRHGIYFAILTLAFAEMVYFAVLAPLQKWTGGDNGLTGIHHAELLGLVRLDGQALYLFAVAWALLALYLARRIQRSPYGLILRAIKSNETRLTYTGINVFRYKVMAFVISGLYGGLAGTLATLHETYVPVASLHWTTSGEIIMMAVIGGLGTLIGPMIGAGIVLYLENVLSGLTAQWYLILGAIFMLIVIFLPGGVMEGGHRLVRLLQRKSTPSVADRADNRTDIRKPEPDGQPSTNAQVRVSTSRSE